METGSLEALLKWSDPFRHHGPAQHNTVNRTRHDNYTKHPSRPVLCTTAGGTAASHSTTSTNLSHTLVVCHLQVIAISCVHTHTHLGHNSVFPPLMERVTGLCPPFTSPSNTQAEGTLLVVSSFSFLTSQGCAFPSDTLPCTLYRSEKTGAATPQRVQGSE